MILCGGKSAEHEISVISARNICKSIDLQRFDLSVVVIDKQGTWSLRSLAELDSQTADRMVSFQSSDSAWTLIQKEGRTFLINPSSEESRPIDVVFPVLHGPNGEDGTMQGLLKIFNLPFVGPSVLGSAIAMDKEVAKRLLRDSGIDSAKFMTVRRHELGAISYEQASKILGSTLFVKPANMGSSVGVKKVTSASEFEAAVREAFDFDHKVLIEESIAGREIEVAVMGNHPLRASVVGEIRPASKHGFYSYESKYLDESGAELIAPAALSAQEEVLAKDLALRAATALECFGMVRVDMFLTAEGRLLVNELNTIPGFTNISMYPRLWSLAGVDYASLINKLIDLALERAVSDNALKTGY